MVGPCWKLILGITIYAFYMFRGQWQERIVMLTNKAVYTFPWNYQNNTTEEKRIHRYEYDTWNRVTVAPLYHTGGKVPKGEDAKFGLRFDTNVLVSTQEKLQQTVVSKLLQPVIFKVLKFMCDKQMSGKETTPKLQFDNPLKPKLPTYEKITEILQAAIASLSKNLDAANVAIQLDGIETPVTVLDVLNLIYDQFQYLEENEVPEVHIALKDYVPNLKLDAMLPIICDELEKVPDFQFTIPMEISLGTMFKTILAALRSYKGNALPNMMLPKLKDMPFGDLSKAIQEAFDKVEKKEKMTSSMTVLLNTGVYQVPPVTYLLSKLASVGITLQFDDYPPQELTEVVEQACKAIAKVSDLPIVNLNDIEVPNIDMKAIKDKLPKLGQFAKEAAGALGEKLGIKAPDTGAMSENAASNTGLPPEVGKAVNEVCFCHFNLQ